ncbi:MAG: TFIIB-type zinc ribbon-containing protein [Candidatus Thorarchaeota archaeon]
MASKTTTKKRELICTECGGSNFTDDQIRGEKICSSCGLVVSFGSIDQRPEWRAYTTEERNARARTGAPMNLMIADKGLSTTIGYPFRDASGKVLSGRQRAAMYRMRKWHFRSIARGSQIGNLRIALSELERLSSILGVPKDTKESASLIYRKALSKRLVRGRSIEGMVAASIYLSCRIHSIPRQLDELAEESILTRREIGKCVRQILRFLNLKVPIPSARNLIPRVAAELGLDGATIRKATSIISTAREMGVTAGKAPGGIAGASIYIAGILTDDRRTQRQIAEATNVTEVTIRNRYKELVRRLNLTPDLAQGQF